MGAGLPKQFRMLRGKALALYSFELFDALELVQEIVVVCEKEHEHLFASFKKTIHFATPGKRRQDSVYNGLLKTSQEMICVHDSARPFVEKSHILTLLETAHTTGAAALAVPATNTIKRIGANGQILSTLKREELWEMQTPQAIKRSLFLKAYEHAQKKNIEATDDLSLVEAMDVPCSIVKGAPTNFKITTPFDWVIAEALCGTYQT